MPVRVHRSVQEVAESVEAIRVSQGSDDFFSSTAWLTNFEQHGLEGDAELRIYCVYDSSNSDVPRVVLPLRSPAGQNGSRLPRRWVGGRSLAGLTNFQSTVFRFPIRGDSREQVESLTEVAEAIIDERPAWSVVDIDMLEGDREQIRYLADAFRSAGWVVKISDSTVMLFESTRGISFDSYLASLPSILKNTLKRRRKKIAREFDVRYEVFVDEESVERAIADYERVLDRSWKQPERFPEFGSGLIRACAQSGTLRLGVLYLDNVPAAVQFWIVCNRQATIYKLHYDEAFKDWSVGTVLTGFMMQHVIEGDEVCEIDFGRDDAPYKRNWLSEHRSLRGLVAFNPASIRGRALLARHVISDMAGRAKGILRRMFIRKARRKPESTRS